MYDESENRRRMKFAIESASRTDIPDILHSEYSGEPFSRCIDCGANLLLPLAPSTDEDAPLGFYQIAKHFVAGEAVFEFALCCVCTEQLQSEFSEETRQALYNHMSAKQAELLFNSPWLLDDPLACCRFCGKEREECSRYSISAICMQAALLHGPGPMMVCEECELQFNELISETTRKRWDRFIEENFDFPPGVDSQNPSNHPILL